MSIKAILLGYLAMTVMDTVLGVASIAIFAGSISEEALQFVQTDTDALWFAVIFGTATTVAGGYIAGLIGKDAVYLNSGMIGVIGIGMAFFFGGGYPLWFNVLGYISTLPAALLGGYLASAGQSSYAYEP